MRVLHSSRKRRLWRQQLESIPPVVLALNDDEKKPDNAAEFPTIVALARDKSFCSMNGNGMLAAEVKTRSQVLKLRAQMTFGKWIEQHQASSGSTNPAKRSSQKMKKHKLLDLLNKDDGRHDTVQDAPDIGPTVKLATTSQMEAAVVALSRKLSKLLTGRASPGMLDHIMVETADVKVPLNRIVVSVLDAHTLSVMPYDSSSMKPIEHIVISSPLGIDPTPDGNRIIKAIPPFREDMFDLAKPDMSMGDKLALLSRLKGTYDCLLPPSSGVLSRL
ncbi:hypothetical protein ABZP36_028215 [Zizania latifolia]